MAITHILQQNCKGIQNLPFSVVIFKNEKSSGGSTFVLVLDGRSCCDESGRDVIVSVICLDNYTYKSPQFPIYRVAQKKVNHYRESSLNRIKNRQPG